MFNAFGELRYTTRNLKGPHLDSIGRHCSPSGIPKQFHDRVPDPLSHHKLSYKFFMLLISFHSLSKDTILTVRSNTHTIDSAALKGGF